MWIRQQPSAPNAVAISRSGWNIFTAQRRTDSGDSGPSAALASAISSADSGGRRLAGTSSYTGRTSCQEGIYSYNPYRNSKDSARGGKEVRVGVDEMSWEWTGCRAGLERCRDWCSGAVGRPTADPP